VTRNGISSTAERYIEDSKSIFHATYFDLQKEVMNFGPYLEALAKEYYEEETANYYVKTLAKNLADGELIHLKEYVIQWLETEADNPLAVLASYGMGKTTFARMCCAELAQKSTNNSALRIPILLRLGEISSEQSLEGLLGKYFTSIYPIQGYTFHAFMRLVRLGRFVIFLDGFDEMKHTLTWPEFKYNFGQLNRLCAGKSKVVLLGRPTAFLSDEEHRHALHGIRSFGDIEVPEENWPDYLEIEIQQFNKEQVSDFLTRYFSTQSEKISKKRAPKYEITRSTLEKISGKQFSDIARRPVQLKMLAEILPHFRGSIDRITSAVLYDEFINLIIERELEKVSRKRFGRDVRRRFVQDVAWWLWIEMGEMSTIQQKIPDSIIQKYSKPRDDLDAVRRDLTAACFLERKYGEALYFPHRSFQEFLVADKIYDLMLSGELNWSVLNEICNPEIIDFLGVLANSQKIAKWTANLYKYTGALPWGLLDIFVSDSGNSQYFLGKFHDQPTCGWWQLILGVGYSTGKFQIGPEELSLYRLLKNDEKEPALTDSQVLFELFVGLLVIGKEKRSDIFLSALSLIDERRDRLLVQFLKKMNFSSKRIGYLDVRGAYKILGTFMSNSACAKEWINDGVLQTDFVSLPEYISDGNEGELASLREKADKLRSEELA